MLSRRDSCRFVAALAFAGPIALAPREGHAQAPAPYPHKAVRIVVPYAPGGAVDPITRMVAERLAKQAGQPFYVENKPGAGGRIGIADVLRQPADGYNVLAGASALAIDTAAAPKGAYDIEKDLAPVALLSRVPMVFVASTDSGFKTLADVFRAAREKPGSINYAVTGLGTIDNLIPERLRAGQKLDMARIDYQGTPAAITAVIGGQVQLMAVAISAVLPQIKAGKVVALAITSEKRAPLLPSVPTMAEAGVPEFVMYGWSTLFVAAATPPTVRQQLNGEVARALSDPQVQKFIADSGSELANLSLPDLVAAMHKDVAVFRDVIRSNSIHIN